MGRTAMRVISSDEIDICLEDRAVLETLRRAFRSELAAPAVPALSIGRPGGQSGSLSFQPAWTDFAAQGDIARGYIGCGLSLDLPEHPGLASSLYVLFSGKGGQPIALLDGTRLAAWRMAGVHALAASYLSREDAARLLIIGENPCLPRLIAAYATIRNLGSVLLCGAARETRRKIAGLPALSKVHVGETESVSEVQDGADMICIAGPPALSVAEHPLARLDPPAGCHVDVLDRKALLPQALLEEARLFTTDLGDPPLQGLEWAADLRNLAQGERAGRRYYGQRTLFLPGLQTGVPDHALAAHVFLRT